MLKSTSPTADLDDPVWSEESVPDNWEYLCIHKIPRSTTPIPAAQSSSPTIPPLQPDQIEMPPDHELIKLKIPEDILDLIDVPEEVISDFDAWAQKCAGVPMVA